MFAFFDHTADLGLRVEAPLLEELFAEAGRGLIAMLVEHPERIAARSECEIRLSASDLEYLFFDWLSELLYRFESERWLSGHFRDIVIQDQRATGGRLELTATVVGDEFRPDEHQYGHEVKAITYHGLLIEQSGGQWAAEVIVDI